MPTTAIYSKFSFAEVNILLKLSIPLILTGLIEASVGFFSTFFLARLGTHELAAGAIVSWVFFTLMVVLWGTLCSISVLVAQKHGAKDHKAISEILRDGLMLGALFVIPASLILWNIGPILLFAKQDAGTAKLAVDYVHGLVWGFLPDFIGLALMQFLLGLGHTRTNLFFSFIWVPLNLFWNYVLMFGKFGFPAMGIAGIGWGTTIAYWISTLLLLLYLVFHPRYKAYFKNILSMRPPKYLRELVQIGVPMGSMYCLEVGFFLMLTLFMGHIGSQQLAANQITLQYLGQLSVVVFSIAQAVTVRMGHTLGGAKIDVANRAAYIGVYIGVFFMVLVGICYWLIPDKLIHLDLGNDHKQHYQLVVYAREFLAISAVFQILEAVRIILFGALRGLKDTRFTLLTSVISFWVIAFPVSYILAFPLKMGGAGLWWGLVLGAVVGVVLLFLRFRYKMKLQYHHPTFTFSKS